MSTVYRAFDEKLERAVAIKVLHSAISSEDDQLERFRREARAAARLSHPNVVNVIDAGEDDGMPYIVFEYVEGETLKERIRRVGRLAAAEAVAYAIEIGRGLTAAHAERLVHRDVKPQNVLINDEGEAKVTDFGIARSLEQDGLTAPGNVLGTTDYVAPEQALGEPVTERSDIYSLGIVLYEMLTGDVPFKADTQVGVAMKHVREPLPDVRHSRPELSALLAAVLERATAKDAGIRYASADELVHELVCRGVADARVLRRRALEHGGQQRRKLRAAVADVRERLAHVLHRHPDLRVGFEGDVSREHLVEHDAQRIDVRALGHRLAQGLLRGHVVGRAEHVPGSRQPVLLERAGDAEVGDLRLAFVVDQHVLGLDVAVHETLGVGSG